MSMEFLHNHSLAILLGIGTIVSFGIAYQNRRELNLKTWEAVLFALLHTIWGVISVSIFAVIEAGFDPESFGNMSLFGGVFMMPAYYFLFAKIKKIKVSKAFDLCTGCMLFTLMCARINCIIQGCCRGILIAGTEMHWPTRELEILFYLILMALIYKKLHNAGQHMEGSIFPVYMMTYGCFRFLTEGLRFYEEGTLIHRGHIWSVISLLIGYSVYTEIKRKKKQTGGKR